MAGGGGGGSQAEQLDTLRSEREILIRRITDLESENADSNVRVNLLESELSQFLGGGKGGGSGGKEDEGQAGGKPSGIVHSVQIRTGGGRGGPGGDIEGSATDSSEHEHQVNIEIKQRHQRFSHPSPRTGKVSVVNLRGSSDNLHHLPRKPAGSRPKLIPGHIVVPGAQGQSNKMSPQLNRVLSNKSLNPKSKSVENLFDGSPAALGLKSANSEMNVHRPTGISSSSARGHLGLPVGPKYQRLKGTVSELNVNRIGSTEKVRVSEAMDGILSMPAELTRTLKMVNVKPNRDKIRQVLNMNNVIELQRQLLTTVMENEVSQ